MGQPVSCDAGGMPGISGDAHRDSATNSSPIFKARHEEMWLKNGIPEVDLRIQRLRLEKFEITNLKTS